MAEELKDSTAEEARSLLMVKMLKLSGICVLRNKGGREIKGTRHINKSGMSLAKVEPSSMSWRDQKEWGKWL